jgi:hypothetical protein
MPDPLNDQGPGGSLPGPDQGSRSHKSYPQDNQSEQSSKAHLEAVFGDQTGWVFIGVGTGHYVADTGKVKHKHWVERSFRWPAQTDEVVAFITEPVEDGAADVYFTPTLSENPVREKPKNAKHGRKPLPVRVLGCDLDGDHDVTRLDHMRSSGGCWMTASGSDGRAHLWVPLVEPADPATAEDLVRRLAAWLDADPSVAWHGAYLRPVGTENWKPFYLTGSEFPAGRVRFLEEPCDPVWTVEMLDDLLPSVEQMSAPVDTPEAEPVVGDLSAELEEILGEPVTVGMDRSTRTMAAVGACVRAGLSDGQVITAMRGHAPTVEKYDGRADAEVARVIGKVRAQEPATIGAPAAKKRPIVDGDKLLDAVHAALVRYVVFPSPEAADAVTLHIAATHAQIAWEHATRLVVKSPVRRCGKTRLLEEAMELCHQVLASTNISTAALVRSIGLVNPPTIVLDEADGVFAKRKGERSEGAGRSAASSMPVTPAAGHTSAGMPSPGNARSAQPSRWRSSPGSGIYPTRSKTEPLSSRCGDAHRARMWTASGAGGLCRRCVSYAPRCMTGWPGRPRHSHTPSPRSQWRTGRPTCGNRSSL